MTTAEASTLTAVTLPVLGATPQAVRTMLAAVPEEVLRTAPAPDAGAGDWSLHTILVHLVDSHRRQVARVRRIVGEERPLLPSVDEWESLVATGLADAPGKHLLDLLASERGGDVPWYASLGPAALARVGVHSVAGEVSAANVLNHAAYHDSQHLGQIARLLEVLADAGRGNMRLAGP